MRKMLFRLLWVYKTYERIWTYPAFKEGLENRYEGKTFCSLVILRLEIIITFGKWLQSEDVLQLENVINWQEDMSQLVYVAYLVINTVF